MKRRIFIAGLVSLGVGAQVAAADDRAWFARGGYAIGGYDPVAYHTRNAAVAGERDISLRWQGAVWLFSSTENRARFEADPTRFAPQYGGYCAFAVANGYTAKTEPDAFSVVNGRLYLNYSRKVRKLWEKDVPGHISAADANWPGLVPK